MTEKDIEGINILYLCDRKQCENCSDVCKHTSDINHAIHKDTLNGRLFEYTVIGEGTGFFEKEILEKKTEWDMDIIHAESFDLGEHIGWNKCVKEIFGTSDVSYEESEG